jgi:hypothetical protein
VPVNTDGCCKRANLSLGGHLVSSKVGFSRSNEFGANMVKKSEFSPSFVAHSNWHSYLGSEPQVLPMVTFWKGAAKAEPTPRARTERAEKNMVGVVERQE